MYVRTYVSVTLRNVNLRPRPGRISDTTCITRRRWDDVFGDGGREDSAAGTTFLATEDGRTARLGLRNVRIWLSQVQKRVLNAADG